MSAAAVVRVVFPFQILLWLPGAQARQFRSCYDFRNNWRPISTETPPVCSTIRCGTARRRLSAAAVRGGKSDCDSPADQAKQFRSCYDFRNDWGGAWQESADISAQVPIFRRDSILRISANKQTSRTLAHKKRTEWVPLRIRKSTSPTFWAPTLDALSAYSFKNENQALGLTSD